MITIVGTIGPVVTGAAGASVTPTWGVGQNRTALNLLLCWCVGISHSYLPATPTGWSVAAQHGTGSPEWASATLLYKIATGADATPTIVGQPDVVWNVRVAEFTGNVHASPLDQSAAAFCDAPPTFNQGTIVAGGTDGSSGDLVAYVEALAYAAPATSVITSSLNNGTFDNNVNNGGVNTDFHYSMGWGVTTSNAVPDAQVSTWTAAGANGSTKAIASFKTATGPGASAMVWNGTVYAPGTLTIWVGPSQPAGIETGDIWYRTAS